MNRTLLAAAAPALESAVAGASRERIREGDEAIP